MKKGINFWLFLKILTNVDIIILLFFLVYQILILFIIYEIDRKHSSRVNSIRRNNKSQSKVRINSPAEENALPVLFSIKNSMNNNNMNKRVQGSSIMVKKRLIEQFLKEAQIYL